MAYWTPSGRGFVPGIPLTNYSEAAMRDLEAAHPGVSTGGAFERVDGPMPGDEPRTTPSEVQELIEEDSTDA
jgi:hypothetical protein